MCVFICTRCVRNKDNNNKQIEDIVLQQWYTHVSTSSMLHYRLFKKQLNLERIPFIVEQFKYNIIN